MEFEKEEGRLEGNGSLFSHEAVFNIRNSRDVAVRQSIHAGCWTTNSTEC